jgi:hypothetical protein
MTFHNHSTKVSKPLNKFPIVTFFHIYPSEYTYSLNFPARLLYWSICLITEEDGFVTSFEIYSKAGYFATDTSS